MKTLQINTTQNVNINFNLADIGQRLLAFVIDNVIKLAYIYTITSLFNFDDFSRGLDNWSVRAIHVLLFLPVTFYSLYLEILTNGQTIGKKALNIKVINKEGYKPSIADYIIRWFMRMVDFNMFMLILIYIFALELDKYIPLIVIIFFTGKLVGFVSILVTKSNQRLGDIAANTVVISLKDHNKFSHTILENISDNYVPKYPNVIRLSDNDARIIKQTYREASKTKDYKTLIKLRTKIEEVTGIKSEEKNDIQFISKILKDYNYYTQNM